MMDGWAKILGLATTPLFARDQSVPDGQHCLLLDGVHGSFGASWVQGRDIDADTRSWAWSCGVLHHVTATNDNIIVRRWDVSDTDRFSASSVLQKLDRFYNYLSKEQSTINRTISTHAIDAFRRLRSHFEAEEQGQALSVFLLLLGAMLTSTDEAVVERSPEVIARFDLSPAAAEGLRRISPEMVRHLISGFRKPTLPHVQQLETLPSLVVRHAGAMVFQEAHFELARRGTMDIFGVPEAAITKSDTGSGIHFTPPGLARALAEQAFQAYGQLPGELTLLDPACGSGSILYEAVRSLRDSGYAGLVRIIGFDASQHAVEMTRFLLSAIKNDWPDFHIKDIRIEKRDSLDEREWPSANIVLMNPPFVSLRSLSAQQKSSISRILGKYNKGRPDLSMAFIERGLRTLRDRGIMATLLPAGVLSMTHAQEWRRHILDEASVSLIATFSELSLFRMATVETGLLLIKKSESVDNFFKSMWVGEKRDSTSDALRFLRRAGREYYGTTKSDRWSLDDVPQAKLQQNPNWRPRPRLLQRQLEAISGSAGSTVGKLFKVKQGALPAPRDAFVIDVAMWHRLSKNEQRWFRRVAENNNIRLGQILPGKVIFFPRSEGLPELDSEETLRKEVPEFFSYLSMYKSQLLKRYGKQERWWELGRDRKWLRSPSKKIVSAYFGQVGSFALDVEGDHVVVQGYAWVPTWLNPGTQVNSVFSEDLVLDAYIALFNSRTFFQVLAEFCPPVGGGQLNLSKRFTEKVPLPDLLTRALASDGVDPILRDLAFIGQTIRTKGLAVAPQSEAENIVSALFGL